MNVFAVGMETQGIGDYVFFQIIYRYLTARIEEFGLDVMGRTMAFAGGVALVLMTIWLMLQGYRILVGQMRGSMADFIYNATRSVIIVSTATTMALFGTDLQRFVTGDLNELITYWVTGTSTSAAELIDRNLAYMQVATSAIDALQVVDNNGLDGAKFRAMLLSGVGIAGPSMSAAAMLLLFHMGMAMFIGFGPLFILALLFDSTRSLFQRWLMYGIGTLFSMAVLAFVTALALKVVGAVAAAFWATKISNALLGSSMTEGMTNQAIQQGGVGLLMTGLILSAPPMAAMFFQGTLGGFMHYSGFADGGRLGSNGQPPGSYVPQGTLGGLDGARAGGQREGGSGSAAASGAGMPDERVNQLERGLASGKTPTHPVGAAGVAASLAPTHAGIPVHLPGSGVGAVAGASSNHRPRESDDAQDRAGSALIPPTGALHVGDSHGAPAAVQGHVAAAASPQYAGGPGMSPASLSSPQAAAKGAKQASDTLRERR